MHSKRWSRLRLEALEQRCTPASVVYTGSLLTVTMNRANTLTVTEVAVGTYQVTEGLANVGTYKTSGITINGTNGNDTITFNFRDANDGGMSGNLTVRPSNGNDTVNINGGADAFGTPVIRGGIIADMGYGNDTLAIGDFSRVAVRGTTNVNGNLGSDTLFIGGQAGGTTTLTALTATDFNNIGIADVGGSGSVTGNATITPGSGAYPMEFTFGALGTINKLAVTGGAQNDDILIAGTVAGNLTAGAEALTVSTGPGDDTLEISGNVGSLAASTGATWNAGDGDDEIITAPGVTVGGNFRLNMVATVNDAGNTYSFGAGTRVGGDLTVSEVTAQGYGNAGPLAAQVITFNGEVGGDVALLLGDSDHTVNFTLAALGGGDYTGYLTVSNYSSNTAGPGGPGGGVGSNTVGFDVGNASQVNIDLVLFGSGNDTLTFTSTANPFTVAGDPVNLDSVLNGGGGANALVFNTPGVVNFQDITPVNF